MAIVRPASPGARSDRDRCLRPRSMCCSQHMLRSTWFIALAAFACGGGGGGNAAEHGASVLELHAGPSRAGDYVDAAFTTAAAATLHLDTTFTAPYTGAAFAQALYLDRGGARCLV